jgi:hypothetical protein
VPEGVDGDGVDAEMAAPLQGFCQLLKPCNMANRISKIWYNCNIMQGSSIHCYRTKALVLGRGVWLVVIRGTNMMKRKRKEGQCERIKVIKEKSKRKEEG